MFPCTCLYKNYTYKPLVVVVKVSVVVKGVIVFRVSVKYNVSY